MKNDNAEPSVPKEVITYAAGAIEARLAEIARDTNQPESELRTWVAIFLLSSWEGLSNSLSPLRGSSTKIYPSARKMAVAHNAHSKSQKKPSDSSNSVTDKRHARKGFKYNGTHWMQQPKNRKRVRELAKARYTKFLQKKAA